VLNLLAVLVAGVLLGTAVWVVGIAAIAWVGSRAAFTGRTLVTTGAAVAATGVVDIAEEYHGDVREELHHGSRRLFGTHMPCTLLYDYQVRIDPGR
jgi:hypothetical protein